MELEQKILEQSAKLGRLLSTNSLKITTVESCTGGGISYALTEVSGSSAYVEECFVTYSNDAKEKLVGVNSTTLMQHGAVSEQTVCEMALGALTQTQADIAIAVSGIAGPDGGTVDKPVGTVWIAWAYSKSNVKTLRFQFDGNRSNVRKETIYQSLIYAEKIIFEFI